MEDGNPRNLREGQTTKLQGGAVGGVIHWAAMSRKIQLATQSTARMKFLGGVDG